MNVNQKLLSPSTSRIYRMKAQGFCDISDADISALAFGNRLTYIICGLLVTYGVATANVQILLGMSLIALFGIILPNHPIDYIYNYLLHGMLNKPKLPRRSKQLKFSCTIATVWLIATSYLFYAGLALNR